MATGTFYLLMVALGCAAGALAAHTGQTTSVQVLAAALVGGGATAVWHLVRSRGPRAVDAEHNRDVNLDIGGAVHVPAWADDGSARVPYRGAAWTVRLAHGGPPRPGPHVIVAMHGNELRVAPAAETSTT
ncbi:MAG: NfeD family protein [Rubrivivax sp.]|nr:NfeD family protein [Rubrivivax sp.]